MVRQLQLREQRREDEEQHSLKALSDAPVCVVLRSGGAGKDDENQTLRYEENGAPSAHITQPAKAKRAVHSCIQQLVAPAVLTARPQGACACLGLNFIYIKQVLDCVTCFDCAAPCFVMRRALCVRRH